MTHVFHSLCFAVLYAYLGLGLTLLIAPPPLARYTLLVSPLIGYGYMTLVGWYFFVTGSRGTDSYATPLMAPAAALLAVGLYAHMRRSREPLLNKDAAVGAALGLLGFVCVALPSVAHTRGLTAMSLGNADIAFYSLMARYLKSFRMNEHVGFFSQEPGIIANAHDRFGTVLVTALPSSVLSLETYQLQNIALHVFFAFTIFMVYIVGREVFRYSASVTAAGTVLTAVNPLLFYTVYHNFEGQIIGMALSLAQIVLHTQALEGDGFRKYLHYLPVTTLLTWGLSVAYGHMVAILLPAIAAYVLLLAWQRRSPGVLIRWSGFSLATLLITIACSPERALLVFGRLTFFGSRVGHADQGWFVPWLVPSGMFMMPRAFPWTTINTRDEFEWAVFIAFFVLMGLGLLWSYRSHRTRFAVIIAWLLVILAGTTALAFADRSSEAWGGYASYKYLSFFLPLVLFGLVAHLPELSQRSRATVAACVGCLGVLLVVSAYFSAREVIVMLKVDAVSPEMAQLQYIESDPRVDSVNIPTGDVLNTMWQTNFLARKLLFTEQQTYFSPRDFRGDWTLVSVKGPRVERILNIKGPYANDIIRVNEDYLLTPTYRELRAQYGAGWYPSEPTLRWMGGDSPHGEVFLDVAREQLPISLSTAYWPLNPRNTLSIYLDGAHVMKCEDNGACTVPRIDLTSGHHVIEFRTAFPPVKPDNGDPRKLSYAFTKIEIVAAR